jgi:hypothetical protein
MTITESFAQFLDETGTKLMFPQMHFMLANVHPIFESWFQGCAAVQLG